MSAGETTLPDRPAMLSVRDEQRLLTRRRIVEAARTVFADRGFGAASISDITSVAGVNRATFYLHFSSKAQALKGVTEPLLSSGVEHWALLDKVLLSGSPGELHEWLGSALAWFEDNADILPALREYSAVNSDPDGPGIEATYRTLATALSGYLARFSGEEQADARIRVQLLVMELEGVAYHCVVRRLFPIERDRLLRLLADSWTRTLRLDA